MLAKSGLLSERERLPTVCVPVVLRKKGYREQGGRWRLSADGDWTQQLRLREVLLWNERPRDWWEREPGLMALFPLCHHNLQPREAVTHAAATIERTQIDPMQRADWLHLLSVFGMMAYPRLNVIELIGRQKMEDSILWKEAMAEGEQRGEQRGKLESRRADIVEALQERLGRAPAEVIENLGAIDDLDVLTNLFRLSLRCGSVDEFREALGARTVRR